MTLEGMLRDLRARCGAEAAAVIGRDGLVVASDIPSSVSRETFSIMCATILGAAMTAATELKKAPPKRVVLESDDTRIVILEAGRRRMLVVVAAADADPDDVEAASEDVLAAADEA
jgi:predicted regulator of Ras-like GTPase activity (Roadblock/LC7/MglB family)